MCSSDLKQRTALLKTYSTNQLVKKRISETIKKVMTNPDRKKKMSEVLKKNWTNPEIRKKMIQSGEKAPNWKGGISFEPYSPEWTKVLKNMIRERDKYICQMCGKTQEEQKRKDGRSLTIHHIDYNKMNCNSENLITLCRSCHSRTSSGKREKWKKFFEEKRYPT